MSNLLATKQISKYSLISFLGNCIHKAEERGDSWHRPDGNPIRAPILQAALVPCTQVELKTNRASRRYMRGGRLQMLLWSHHQALLRIIRLSSGSKCYSYAYRQVSKPIDGIRKGIYSFELEYQPTFLRSNPPKLCAIKIIGRLRWFYCARY